MKISKQFYGLKEIVYVLSKREIIDACIRYIYNNRVQEDLDNSDCIADAVGRFLDDDGYEVSLSEFKYVISFKKEKMPDEKI